MVRISQSSSLIRENTNQFMNSCGLQELEIGEKLPKPSNKFITL